MVKQDEERAMKRIFSLSILMAATVSFASAQDAGSERDPFFSAGPRASGPAASPEEGEWGRDPFNRQVTEPGQPAPAREGRAPGVKLSGIIYGKDVRLAIIGGEAHREGSMIGDQKLLEIGRHSVILTNSAGNREEVLLEDFSIRK
jgi:hypothetical protein